MPAGEGPAQVLMAFLCLPRSMGSSHGHLAATTDAEKAPNQITTLSKSADKSEASSGSDLSVDNYYVALSTASVPLPVSSFTAIFDLLRQPYALWQCYCRGRLMSYFHGRCRFNNTRRMTIRCYGHTGTSKGRQTWVT